MSVRVKLPTHLRRLARVDGEISVDVAEPVTLAAVLDAVESLHPELQGAIRDRATGRRRAFVRYFACEEDLSHEPPDTPLPEPRDARRRAAARRGGDGGRLNQRTYSASRSRQSGIATPVAAAFPVSSTLLSGRGAAAGLSAKYAAVLVPVTARSAPASR